MEELSVLRDICGKIQITQKLAKSILRIKSHVCKKRPLLDPGILNLEDPGTHTSFYM